MTFVTHNGVGFIAAAGGYNEWMRRACL